MNPVSLKEIYEWAYADKFGPAIVNFVESLAGYSLFSYIFDLKDRHNGNILLDGEGRMLHIDFGFILTNISGGILCENEPFKLT